MKECERERQPDTVKKKLKTTITEEKGLRVKEKKTWGKIAKQRKENNRKSKIQKKKKMSRGKS